MEDNWFNQEVVLSRTAPTKPLFLLKARVALHQLRVPNIMTRVMRCHDFGSGSDKAMGQNSRQPEGLRPQRPLTLSGGLLIFAI